MFSLAPLSNVNVDVVLKTEKEMPLARVVPSSYAAPAAPAADGEVRRKGKWTVAEADYAQLVISHYREGLLTLPVGVTVRSCLSVALQCDPMRITKKFAGASCIRKRVRYCNGGQPHHWATLVRALVERLQAEAHFWDSIGNAAKAGEARASAMEAAARLSTPEAQAAPKAAPAPAPVAGAVAVAVAEPLLMPRMAPAPAPVVMPFHDADAIASLLAPLEEPRVTLFPEVSVPSSPSAASDSGSESSSSSSPEDEFVAKRRRE